VSDPDVVLCHTLHDPLVLFPHSALAFRPLVPSMTVDDNQLSLPPDRLHRRGESPCELRPDALGRKPHEETGLLV